MKIFKKEKKVVKLILSHIDTTAECVSTAIDVLKKCINGCSGDDCAAAKEVGRLEGAADNLLREIRELMYSGAYLPLMRADIYRLMSTIDDVANKTEECTDMCCLQNPQVDAEYHAQIIEVLDLTSDCYAEFLIAAKSYFDPKRKQGKLREHVRNVGEIESQIDEIAGNMVRQLFASSKPLPEKMHLQVFITEIIRISDKIEDAADELDLLNVKSLL